MKPLGDGEKLWYVGVTDRGEGAGVVVRMLCTATAEDAARAAAEHLRVWIDSGSDLYAYELGKPTKLRARVPIEITPAAP